jgi:cytochrome bd-type quinol oxidase subunit 2
MTIDWLALLQVAVVTIVGAVAVAALLSLANWLLTPNGEAEQSSLPRRVAGYAVITVMGGLIFAALYLMAHEHVARLLGLS